MLIEMYPKPDGMQHINLMFCEEEPDPEDGWIRSHIQEFPVPPKRSFTEQRAGRQYTTLQFGQCVIGHSMFYIEKHKGVVDKIQTVCRQDLKQAELDRPTRNILLSRLAMELDKQARYTIDESGDLTIAIDEKIMRRRLLELMEEQAESVESEA